MRALVTGCAGFIGSHLAEALLQDGHSVRGVDCLTNHYDPRQKLQNLERARDWSAFELAHADLASDDLDTVVDDCDVIFHLAAEAGVRSSWGARFHLYTRNNVLATQRLLEAVKRQPKRRFVLASSSSIYGEPDQLPTPESTLPRPLSPYGVTKLAAEQLAQLYTATYGVETVSLRYFSVYGPRQRPDAAFHRFIRAALEGSPLKLFGDGSQRRDFTFVSDAVSGTIAAASTPSTIGGAYNIGGRSSTSLRTAIALIGEITGRPLEIRSTPPARGDTAASEASIDLASRDFGYSPQVALHDGLRAEFDWLLDSVRASAHS